MAVGLLHTGLLVEFVGISRTWLLVVRLEGYLGFRAALNGRVLAGSSEDLMLRMLGMLTASVCRLCDATKMYFCSSDFVVDWGSGGKRYPSLISSTG